MDFPIESDWDDAPAESVSDRVLVPEGKHEFAIKQVIENEHKLEVRLAHDEKRFGWVFFSIEKKRSKPFQRKLLGQLAASLAISPEQWETTDAGDLAGRRVVAEVKHRTSDSGRTFVNVWGFSPIEQLRTESAAAAPAAAAPAAKPKRTASAKATASLSDPADDIPF